jgi:hypothetical protein
MYTDPVQPAAWKDTLNALKIAVKRRRRKKPRKVVWASDQAGIKPGPTDPFRCAPQGKPAIGACESPIFRAAGPTENHNERNING